MVDNPPAPIAAYWPRVRITSPGKMKNPQERFAFNHDEIFLVVQ